MCRYIKTWTGVQEGYPPNGGGGGLGCKSMDFLHPVLGLEAIMLTLYFIDAKNIGEFLTFLKVEIMYNHTLSYCGKVALNIANKS